MQGLKKSDLIREGCLINGTWVPSKSGETLSVTNPYDNSIIGHVPNCDSVDTADAIVAAHIAFPAWKNLTAKERSDILLKWSRLIDENQDDLARIMTLEQGKPLKESLGEIIYANGFIKWFAEEGRRVYGDVIPSNRPNQHLIVIKQPIGVVAAITPWNFPSAMITRKIAPALAVGCTVVVKPDSQTPFSAFALGVLANEAGFPKGVVNILTGPGEVIGKEMTSNPLVRKLSFTGSTSVGSLLMKQCAPTLKKITLELGGNAPFIVFDDANIEEAVKGAISSKFRNSGQTCVCANRILVQDKIYDTFSKEFTKATAKLKVGNGLDDVDLGPLINEKAVNKVNKHVQDATTRGAKILSGGQRLKGLFFEPTVLTEVNESMLLANEETFGPVAPLFRFQTEEEAIQIANNTEFGLASYFYSQSMDRIWRVSEALEYGMVGINTGIVSTEVAPFGGIKHSGMGREGSKYGVEPYLEIKYICMQGRV